MSAEATVNPALLDFIGALVWMAAARHAARGGIQGAGGPHPVKTAQAENLRMSAEAPTVNPALLDFIGAPTTQGTNVKSAATRPIHRLSIIQLVERTHPSPVKTVEILRVRVCANSTLATTLTVAP